MLSGSSNVGNIFFYALHPQAMVETQTRLQNYVDGFHFNLGFSGKFFHHGSLEENSGDDALIGKRLQQNIFVDLLETEL